MSRVLRYGKGRGSIEIEGTQRDLIMDIVKQSDPIIVKVLEARTEELAKTSEKKWLVRQKKYGKSEGSKYKHRTGLRIIPPYTIQAFVENYSQYAWAIKVGPTSDTNLRQGRRLAEAVLWSPARRGAQKVVETIANEMVKQMRKS